MTQDRIIVTELSLSGLKLAKRIPVVDQRGFLQRLYCANVLSLAGIREPIAQINLTMTHRSGAVRGMHFQRSPYEETKMVSCLRGKVFDVAVDLRQNSPTFMKWHAEILSPELANSLIIPKGFAHGFQALTPDCELLYFHTAAYNPAAEGGVSPLDPALNISWPLEIADISDRDKSHPFMTGQYEGLLNEV